jgi:hypothetical protein
MNIDEVKVVSSVPTIDRIVQFLDKMKFKEVVTTAELADAISISYGRLKTTYTTAPSLVGYRLKVQLLGRPNQTVWGSKKTIEELKRRVGL